MSETGTVTLGIRLDPAELQTLREIGTTQKRSAANMGAWIISQWLKNEAERPETVLSDHGE